MPDGKAYKDANGNVINTKVVSSDIIFISSGKVSVLFSNIEYNVIVVASILVFSIFNLIYFILSFSIVPSSGSESLESYVILTLLPIYPTL